jgi:xanthine dehydrogenase accessory factor
MAVGPAGVLAGTIGGGAAEAGLVETVVGRMRSGDLHPQRVLLEHREGAVDASGMICGGSQTVVVSPIGDRDRPDLAAVVEALSAGRRIEWSVDPQGWCVAAEPGADWVQRLCSGPTHSVHVIGAGHIGRALSRILVDLDFRVVVIDERPGLLDAGVDAAHERIPVPYERLARVVTQGPDSYVAIMTHSHERDAVALSALERLDLGYLGLLGSRAKVRRIVGERAMPAWFHAPMGLPIGSTTPTEIAVSIAAQMVAVRSG